MDYTEVTVESPIDKKIRWACDCFNRYKNTFLSDKKTEQLLKKFHEASGECLNEMIRIGLVDECRRCEKEEGGSCCGAGIENRYSGTLLLINLLLGGKLPEKAYDSGSCFFLGPEGCSLFARHVICVNYICNKITDKISLQLISSLREKEGAALEILFILNERIKYILRNVK